LLLNRVGNGHPKCNDVIDASHGVVASAGLP